jgi:hypothetical protein
MAQRVAQEEQQWSASSAHLWAGLERLTQSQAARLEQPLAQQMVLAAPLAAA